jgi:hypothetical protein
MFDVAELALRWDEATLAARARGSAVIVDTDGSRFAMTPVGASSREQFALKGLHGALRILRLAALPVEVRDPVLYGEFAWIATLRVESQVEFAWAYARALEAIPEDGVAPVEDLMYDWQQTARAYADRPLRDRLLGDIETPSRDADL